jgi:hypothetical protein
MNKNSKPRGAVAVIVAVGLIALLAVTAFAVDFGGYYVARNEVQNSADAGALAGAGRLVKNGELNWTEAERVAEEVGKMNKSSSGETPEIDVIAGYWNAESKEIVGRSIPSQGAENYFPAVKVIASRTEANGNPVPIYFAYFQKKQSFDVALSAMAIISGPSFIDRRDLFAFAISRCVYDQYWDYSLSPPGPRLNNGEPIVFRLGRGAGPDPLCGLDTIVWTPLTSGGNVNTNLVSQVIVNYQSAQSDPTPFSIGDPLLIWRSNVSQAVYNAIEECFIFNKCRKVVVPVVSDIPSAGGSNTRPIQAFACLTIIAAAGSGNGYVDVAMDPNCPPPPSAGGIGPIFGTVTPPGLVQ